MGDTEGPAKGENAGAPSMGTDNVAGDNKKTFSIADRARETFAGLFAVNVGRNDVDHLVGYWCDRWGRCIIVARR